MEKLYFPKKERDSLNANSFLFDSNHNVEFLEAANTLEDEIRNLEKSYLSNPSSVSQQDITKAALDTYSLTVKMFDKKIEMGISLLPEEKKIYDLCKSELRTYESETPPVNSILGVLFNAIERVRDCFDEVKEWFGLSSDVDKAGMTLVHQGNVILPYYATLVEGFFTNIVEFFASAFTPTVLGIAEAQAECALRYQQKRTVDKKLASTMLDIADYAYSGHSTAEAGKFVKLSKSELPQSIRILYDEDKGLLKSSRGLQAWLGKKDNDYVVAYAGTDISSFDMVYADIIQLSSPSTLYLKCAGLLKILLDNIPNKNFYVTGHSLGGGITQFAATANMNLHESRIQGFGYNPAGLSMISIRHLESSRMLKSKSRISQFMTSKDPVSLFGGKIGCLTTLPKTGKDGHGIDDLKVCMEKYVGTPEPPQPGNISITLRNHVDSDFIPYTRTLSLKDQSNKIYPIFNCNVGSQSADFLTAKIPKPIFEAMSIPQVATSSCMGIYNKFNGTAHTVVNRLLLLAADEPEITTASIGNIHSSMMFGKFGLGIKDFLPLLEAAYSNVSVNRTTYEKVLSNLNNPFEYNKEAWCTGIRIEFAIDMYTVFSQWPLAESIFDAFLFKFENERIDLYQSLYKGSEPDEKVKKDFAVGLKQILVSNTNSLMSEAVNWGVISNNDKANYQQRIAYFCDRILAAY